MRTIVRELTTERKLGIAFAVALITIAGLAYSFYANTRDLFESNDQVAKTLEVMMVLGNTLARLNEAETSQRGYILTGDRKFLSHYPESIAAVRKQLQRLRTLIETNPKQLRAIDRLDPLVQERIGRMEESITLRQEKGFEPALEAIVTRRGYELMREIREVIQEMQTEEENSLERRYIAIEKSSRNTLTGFLVIVLLNFVLLSLVYLVVRNDLIGRQRNLDQKARLVRNLEAANQQLRDFAHIVSHDLKAPLRGINSMATFLSMDYEDKLDADGREQLQLLSRRVQRMHDFIEGILHYSQLVRKEEEREKVDLNKLVKDVWDLVSAPAHIKLSIERPLPTLTCDKMRMQQIFQNLLSNAVKFNNKPSGLIQIRWKDEGKNLIFSVSDNGPGIEQKYFGKIFQLFQTLHARDEVESTGIGLAVVKKAVELSGGQIWLESKVGLGSTFSFSMPIPKSTS